MAGSIRRLLRISYIKMKCKEKGLFFFFKRQNPLLEQFRCQTVVTGSLHIISHWFSPGNIPHGVACSHFGWRRSAHSGGWRGNKDRGRAESRKHVSDIRPFLMGFARIIDWQQDPILVLFLFSACAGCSFNTTHCSLLSLKLTAVLLFLVI